MYFSLVDGVFPDLAVVLPLPHNSVRLARAWVNDSLTEPLTVWLIAFPRIELEVAMEQWCLFAYLIPVTLIELQ